MNKADFVSLNPQLFHAIDECLPAGSRLYLVGGAVRDVLLKRPLHDFDFAAAGDVKRFGKRLAESLSGAYFPMDEERGIVRVIVNTPENDGYSVDIARLSGETIEDDLRGRDFTINAVAVEITDEINWTDIHGGIRDLQNRVLRMCSRTSLRDDPVRAIRAIRMALQFGLSFDPELETALSEIAPCLPESSFERYRDELIRIMSAGQCGKAYARMRGSGIWEHLFPGRSTRDTAETAELIDRMARTLSDDAFLQCFPEEDPDGITPDCRQKIRAFFETVTTADHTILQLTLIGVMLFADDPAEDPKKLTDRLKRLTFSGEETAFISQLYSAVRFLSENGLPEPFDELEIYRFYKKFKKIGPSVFFIRGEGKLQDTFQYLPQVCDAYFHRYDRVIDPKPLLDGNQIGKIMHIKPGPRIGQVNELLLEQQVCGKVNDRKEAESFVRRLGKEFRD